MGNVTVTPGTLPDDGERVIPAQFVPEFVRTSEITDIPSTAFTYGNLSFIAAQTDPPTISRGLVWFERGAGKLYIAETMDRGGDTCSSGPLFVQMAPGREVLMILDNALSLKRALRHNVLDNRQNFFVNNQSLQYAQLIRDTSDYSGGIGDWPVTTYVANTGVSCNFPADSWVVRAVERGWATVQMGDGADTVVGETKIGQAVWSALETDAENYFASGFNTIDDESTILDGTKRLEAVAGESHAPITDSSYDMVVYKRPTADWFKATAP